MTEQKDIFHDEDWFRELNHFISYLDKHNDNISTTMKGMIHTLLKSPDEPGIFALTESEIGSAFRGMLKNTRYEDDPFDNFLWLFRYILELNCRGAEDLEEYIERIYQKVPEELKRTFYYWRQNTERLILKRLLQKPTVKSLESLQPSFITANNLAQAVDEMKDGLTSALQNAEGRLANWKEDLGFVELANGFRDMRKQKSEESRRTLNVLVGLAVTISLFPIAAHLQFRGGDQFTWLLAFQAVPFVAMEFIFIYYFRLTYARYKSFEAQKLQLDHRIALLQFIQRYAIFRDGKQGLGKFEELIFSGIVASEEAIPSMFDGIDHLARLIGSARGDVKTAKG